MWGRSGEVYDLQEVDVKDPNYDEAQVVTALLTILVYVYHVG